jgi:uncharacterized protein (TIGR00730 family)
MRITILGWKRNTLPEYCSKAEKLCFKLSKKNHTIITGGGTGIMGSSNKGAFEANKENSIGITVDVILDEKPNVIHNILEKNYIVEKTFHERKKKLMHDTDINIFFPGGMGTLDEFSDLINLYKTKSIVSKPIICVGEKYYYSLMDWFSLNKIVFPKHLISLVTDDIDLVVDKIDKLS